MVKRTVYALTILASTALLFGLGLDLTGTMKARIARAEVSVIETTSVLDVEVHTSIHSSAVSPIIRRSFEPGEDIEATAEFDVSANVPRVRLQVAVTDLHFIRDPNNVDPIPVDRSRGVQINAAGATVIGGNGNVDLTNEQDVVDGYTAYKTEEVTFQADGGVHSFENRVFITAHWDNRSAEYPAGNYEGRIKLICAVEPPL